MTAPPIPMRYEGDGAFIALPRFRQRCNESYAIGEDVQMQRYEPRSQRSHNHFFALIHEAWANLPEMMAERFPTSEHLRKYCLIRAGYSDISSIVAASKAEAQRIAAFIKPIDEFSVVIVNDSTVTRYTARSQSLKAMGRAEFQKSKDAVLEFAASLIGVEPSALARNAGAAA